MEKFRAWDKRTKLMNDVTTIDLEKEIVFLSSLEIWT